MSGLFVTLAVATAHHRAGSSTLSVSINYVAIMPIIIMVGGAVLLLAVASLIGKPLRMTAATGGTIVIALTALGFAIWQWFYVQSHGPSTTMDHALAVDGFSAAAQILAPCAIVLAALVADGYLRRQGVVGPEFHVLALIAAAGAMVMAEANDLIVIFLGLEILSLPLYVLTAFNSRRTESGEAALKYFILGAFSSAIFVYGIALTYGATGSTNLTQIADFLSRNVVITNGLLLSGLALLLVGFGFKIAAVPFHMWTPDVYQGAPSPVTGFMASVAKIGAFLALLRVFVSSFGLLRTDWQPAVYAIAVATLLLGAGLAIVQRDVKRMLAYATINTVGFILLGVQAGTDRGVSSALYYVFVYTFMVIGSFGVVTILGGRADRSHDIAGYRGLAARHPLLALSFAILLLAQAGAPFTTGLWAKLQVVLASVDAGSTPLAVIAMVSAAVAAFFYLRVAVLMYTPVRAADERPGEEEAGEEPDALLAGDVGPSPRLDAGEGPEASYPPPIFTPRSQAPLWEGSERAVAVITRLNAELLIDDATAPGNGSAPATNGSARTAAAEQSESDAAAAEDLDEPEEPEPDVVTVPITSAVGIGLCVAFTVVFGIWPAPIVDLAHQATLLFR